MTLPDLSELDSTRKALHQSIQVLRSTRLLGVAVQPNEMEYGTIPTPYGATTGPLSFGGELKLDYRRAAFVYEKDGKTVFTVGLAGHNQTSVFDAVFAAFKEAGHTFAPNRGKITETMPFDINTDRTTQYADMMWRMFQIIARLKGRMFGPQSPIMLWPHNFDLSTLWFVDGLSESDDPHVNFGFTPYTSDVGQGYFYVYARPTQDALKDKLSPLFTWTTAWSRHGGYITYEQILKLSDPDETLFEVLLDAYRDASAILKASVSG